ncbi:uncharacterized protein si:ch73-364h19.1 isoform X2 [Ctenopharyngodon idella]|uniref:uncharacterized protein si:ch73-364h19.1 isoform X2 n=1 Tax=Ctenopharyngodon idella TaxID=7959 RepID=UPI00223145FF|nr:uncharacterized protein si:ch73-364h19.1 isoform X2 [Ctenopharyngodon idella]
MSTTVSPTVPSMSFIADQRTIVVGAFCCLVFFFMIVVLLLILYRKVPLCCKMRVYQESRTDMEAPPQYYNSRQTLVASSDVEQTHDTGHDNVNAQPPPTYEESIRQSVQSIDVPFDILAPEEHPITVSEPGTDLPAYEALPHITDSQDPNDIVH